MKKLFPLAVLLVCVSAAAEAAILRYHFTATGASNYSNAGATASGYFDVDTGAKSQSRSGDTVYYGGGKASPPIVGFRIKYTLANGQSSEFYSISPISASDEPNTFSRANLIDNLERSDYITMYAQDNTYQRFNTITRDGVTTGLSYAQIQLRGTTSLIQTALSLPQTIDFSQVRGSPELSLRLQRLVSNAASGDPTLLRFRLTDVSVVPIPAAVWLFGSALASLAGINYKRRKTSDREAFAKC